MVDVLRTGSEHTSQAKENHQTTNADHDQEYWVYIHVPSFYLVCMHYNDNFKNNSYRIDGFAGVT